MRVKFIQDVKDRKDDVPVSFVKGDILTVSDRDGGRYMGHGWALEAVPDSDEFGLLGGSAPSGDAGTSSVDLDVHNATLGSSDNLGA